MELIEREFDCRGQSYRVRIAPSRIKDSDGVSRNYFPGKREELVEDALRKIATAGQRAADVTDEELRAARRDVFIGMFFSNLVMYFIILTTAATLHAHGQTDIKTARDTAEALRPLAGNGAYLLFTLGIIGTGLLAIPVLPGSAAYAVAEAEQWQYDSLADRPLIAPRFYAVVGAAMLLGLGLDFIGFNAVKMLFYSAVLNGMLAPPLIVLVILLTSNPEIMDERVSSRPLRFLGWATSAIMTVAAVRIFVTM